MTPRAAVWTGGLARCEREGFVFGSIRRHRTWGPMLRIDPEWMRPPGDWTWWHASDKRKPSMVDTTPVIIPDADFVPGAPRPRPFRVSVGAVPLRRTSRHLVSLPQRMVCPKCGTHNVVSVPTP